MYPITLTVHSLVRWVVLLVGFWAVARALIGASARRQWTPSDDAAGKWFTIAMDVQLLLGLLLYGVLSPMTRAALMDMGSAMRDPVTRFWAVEHITMMIVAVVLAHVGRARVRKAAAPAAAHRTAAIFYTLALVIVLAAIPWPFTSHGRPWVRLEF
jgi:hypothetical protein